MAEAEARRRKAKFMVEVVGISFLCILGLFGIAALFWWAIFLKSL